MGAGGAANPAYVHGHTTGGFSPEYQSWSSMVQRCTNEKRDSWKYYGGRGIRVCDRWLDFQCFLSDMGPRPEGTTLDRRDTNGNYEPGNCRWADALTQSRNRRPRDVNEYRRDRIISLLTLGPHTLPMLVDELETHRETVNQLVRGLRAAGRITTTRGPATPGSRGRTLVCSIVRGAY